jgi:hypothetical protein
MPKIFGSKRAKVPNNSLHAEAFRGAGCRENGRARALAARNLDRTGESAPPDAP